jgi:transposase InsO family protein
MKNPSIYPNLLDQNFSTTAPGKVWVSDITYVWTHEGWLYLASVMDLYSRKIIGFHMSNRMTKELVITALYRTMMNQPPNKGLIHHSDRGSQNWVSPTKYLRKTILFKKGRGLNLALDWLVFRRGWLIFD